jgi:hypothetical protein
MKIWIGAAALMLPAHSAFAAAIAVCTLSADKKTVTVTATNPYAQEMACEVNCDMAIPNGIATVVCVKPVPAGAKDFVMCDGKGESGGPYTRVKGADVNCPDPTAKPAAIETPPAAADADADDDDDPPDAPPAAAPRAKPRHKDAVEQDVDALVKKLEKDQLDLMNQKNQK